MVPTTVPAELMETVGFVDVARNVKEGAGVTVTFTAPVTVVDPEVPVTVTP
jgi:hypothetical protein